MHNINLCEPTLQKNSIYTGTNICKAYSAAPDVDTIPTGPLAAPPLAAAFPAPAAVALLLPRLQMARVTAAAVKVTTRVLQL